MIKKRIKQITDGAIISIIVLVLFMAKIAPIIWAASASYALLEKGYVFCATLLLITSLIMWFTAMHTSKNEVSDPKGENITMKPELDRKTYIWLKTLNRKELGNVINNTYKQGVKVGRRAGRNLER